MSHPDVTIHCGDALAVLRTIPAESVNCCVTSPPYWGLRDYNVPPTAWGGDVDCSHEWGDELPGSNRGGSGTPTDKNGRGENYGRNAARGRFCQKCKAWLGCLGLEPTPQLFVQHIVEVFREVRRVLRKNGTLWLNIGDSSAASGKSGGGAQGKRWEESGVDYVGPRGGKFRPAPPGLKPKDLVGIPWMTAFALRDDGWVLRQDIIWSKNNCMPESVRDRCTRSHEYIFMFAKQSRYYYDAEAIKEPGVYLGPNGRQQSPYAQGFARRSPEEEAQRRDKQRGHGRRHAGFNDRWDAAEANGDCSVMRNKRSVWTVATKPFNEAHFATFPPELIRPCVLAGCPEGGTVVDPFGGSFTTAEVAIRTGRRAIVIELNPDYVEIGNRRLAGVEREIETPLLDAQRPEQGLLFGGGK